MNHMSTNFLIYGANGFVGSAAARLAIQSGLRPILAGRNGQEVEHLANELDVEFREFKLNEPNSIDAVLKDMPLVLHCAGPYKYTSKPMADACLRTGVHYLDITGEIPVYQALAAQDSEAKSRGVMLLPGVGFDVVPTDCLALHLKQRLPTATHLTLAFQSVGPAGLPPGTQRTMIELIPFGDRIRRNGQLEIPEHRTVTRQIEFDKIPVEATRFTWGDVFMAYYSTGIPNIEDYLVLPPEMLRQLNMIEKLRFVFRSSLVRKLMKRGVKPGPTPSECAQTKTHVWGEVIDDSNNKVVSRLHGPEAGLTWTTLTAIEGVKKVLSGQAPPGFQTPAMAFGADFVLECEGVIREDLS